MDVWFADSNLKASMELPDTRAAVEARLFFNQVVTWCLYYGQYYSCSLNSFQTLLAVAVADGRMTVEGVWALPARPCQVSRAARMRLHSDASSAQRVSMRQGKASNAKSQAVVWYACCASSIGPDKELGLQSVRQAPA